MATRKGLNLREGNDADGEPDLTTDQSIQEQSVENASATTVIEADVVAPSYAQTSADDKSLFPTFARGFRKVGDLLRTDVTSKQ